MAPIDLPDTIDLAFDKIALPDDGRSDPLFAIAPPPPGINARADKAPPLDAARVEFNPEPPPGKRRSLRGPAGSLILHLLPLLLLISWPRTPLETPAPIAVQLVIEQPPPPPPLPAEPKPAAKPPPPGRLSSDDFAAAEGPKTVKGSGEAPPSAGEPPPPTEAQAAETPPAKAASPLEQSNEEPRAPTETQTAELPPPKPAPPPPKPKPPKEQAAARMPKPLGDMWPLPLESNEARRTAARIGPNATRDEYCAYALNLTLRHLDLLPRSLVGARHGATVLSIRVLEDGTIKNVMVARSSGYPDIDARVEQMVYAVGRFPPLPQWVARPWMDFTFQLHFPHPLEH